MLNVSLVERERACWHFGGGVNILSIDHRRTQRIGRGIALALVVLLAGCATKPKLPPGVHPSVEVGPPLKSDVWKAVATPADQDRLARLGLAWQEALDEARRANAADVAKEGKLLLPR